jgi:hypothetical protein
VDGSGGLAEGGEGLGPQAALSTLFQLEATIEERRTAPIADGECLLALFNVFLSLGAYTCLCVLLLLPLSCTCKRALRQVRNRHGRASCWTTPSCCAPRCVRYLRAGGISVAQ